MQTLRHSQRRNKQAFDIDRACKLILEVGQCRPILTPPPKAARCWTEC